MEKQTCPCCGYKTLDTEHEYDICPICFWEDDWVQYDDPDAEGGANHISLRQAQRNYHEIGACAKDMLEHVRKPTEDDMKDENWRPLYREKPMKVSVILGHPYEYSFNHAIAKTVVERLSELGHEVHFHDLCEEGFEAALTGHELVSGKTSDALVQQHMDEIREAEGIVIIHPNWWGMPPAILKGWVDRVLRNGVAYAFDENDDGSGVPQGLLKAEAALVFNTANTPEERENTVFGDPLETIWKNCIFDFCGVKNYHRHIFRVIAGSTERERAGWLAEAGEMVERYMG